MIFLIVLLSAGLSTWMCYQRSALQAFLNVYLPLLVFWPTGYGINFHGVLINPEMAAALPLSLRIIQKPAIRWSWRISDLVIVLYVLEAFYAQYHVNYDFSVAGVDGVQLAFTVIPMYLCGRYLVDAKEARVLVAKRFVFLLFIVAFLSLYEYRMGMNPFEMVTSRVTGLPSYFFQQLRWGFARVGGPFSHAILAGIMFVSGLLLQLWLASQDAWEKKFRRLAWLPGSKTLYLTLGMLAAVWMTQSRGPWMGGFLGFLLFLGGRAKKVKRGITRAVTVTLVLLAVFYVVTDRYTNAGDGPVSQDKENAVYRRQLLINYMPIVKEGGLWGQGRDFPHIPGQMSIDNYYLLTALQTGYAGVGLFTLMIAMASLRLLRTAWLARSRADATFALCLLGITVGIGATVTTVYLGAQTVFFLFLIFGWAQAVDPRRVTVAESAVEALPEPTQRFAYRRVFS